MISSRTASSFLFTFVPQRNKRAARKTAAAKAAGEVQAKKERRRSSLTMHTSFWTQYSALKRTFVSTCERLFNGIKGCAQLARKLAIDHNQRLPRTDSAQKNRRQRKRESRPIRLFLFGLVLSSIFLFISLHQPQISRYLALTRLHCTALHSRQLLLAFKLGRVHHIKLRRRPTTSISWQ